MTHNDSSLENLEFFDMFSNDDPLANTDSYDPNKNIAPDILNGNPLPVDPNLADSDSTDDDDDTPPAGSDLNSGDEDDDEDSSDDSDDLDSQNSQNNNQDVDDEDEDEDDINYFEVFGKGLAKVGMLEIEEGEEIEWSEETFLAKMEETVEKKAWDTLEGLALETYGEAGVKMVEDLFINKAPIQQYLQMFNNEQIVENVDLSSVDNQERVIRLYLAKTGMDEDSINDQVSFMVGNDKLEAYAQKYHSKLLEKMESERQTLALKSKEAQDRQRELENQRKESYAQVLKDSIKSGEIQGYPINPNDAEDLFSFVLDKPHQLPNGQRISDFEYKLAKMRQEDPKKFLAVARLIQADLDLTPVKKRGVSEETNTIFNELKVKTKKTTKSNRSASDTFSQFFNK